MVQVAFRFWKPQVKIHSIWKKGKEPLLIDESQEAREVVCHFANNVNGPWEDYHYAGMDRRKAISCFEHGLERGQLAWKFYKLVPVPVDEEAVQAKRDKRVQRRAERKTTTDSLPAPKESKSRPVEQGSKAVSETITKVRNALGKSNIQGAVGWVKQARSIKGKTRQDRMALRQLEKQLGLRGK